MPEAQAPPVAWSVPSPEIEAAMLSFTTMAELALPDVRELVPYRTNETMSGLLTENAKLASLVGIASVRSWSSTVHPARAATRTWPSVLVPASA